MNNYCWDLVLFCYVGETFTLNFWLRQVIIFKLVVVQKLFECFVSFMLCVDSEMTDTRLRFCVQCVEWFN